MAAKGKISSSPNVSLQEASTNAPSTRLGGDRSSLDGFSLQSSKRLLTGGTQIGGGSYDSYMEEHKSRLEGDIEYTTRKLELEQRRRFRLDKDLTMAESEFTQKRARYKKWQSAEDDAVANKAADVLQLEKRLELAIAELNRGNSDNKTLRDQVDALRKERQLMDAVFKQVEKGISGSRRAIDDLNGSINADRLGHNDAQEKAEALSKMLERERRAFHCQTEEMKVNIQKENDIQREQDISKGAGRIGHGAKHGSGKKNYMVADEEEAFSEHAMHRRILKVCFLNTIQRRHIKQHQKNIEVFEQAFATIKSSTGISDIEEIVKIFIGLEQRNFSLLTYVNQLNREIESIEIRNRELHEQLEVHQLEEMHSDHRKSTALSEITSQIGKTRAATVEKDTMVNELATSLEGCRPHIWNIVSVLKEEIPTMVSVGYEGATPTMKIAAPDEHDSQMNHHLMYLEEALLLFKMCLSTDASQKSLPRSAAQNGAKKHGPAHTELPSAHLAGDDSDDDDAGIESRPWNRGELRDKAQATIQRRRRKPGAGQGRLGGHEERGTRAEFDEPVDLRRDISKDQSDRGRERSDDQGSFCKSPSMMDKTSINKEPLQEDASGGGREAMWWRGGQQGAGGGEKKK